MTCETFNITNDQIDEEDKSFEISFTVPAGIIPPSTNPMVTIIDDESKLIMQLIMKYILIEIERKKGKFLKLIKNITWEVGY